MRSRFLAPLILPVVLLATSFSPIAQAAVNDRIAGSINSGSRVALPGMVVARAKHSTDLGLAPANKKLDSLSLHFSMTAAQQADLTQLLAAQLNPGSPSYHQWLTPEQFGARFGLSSADLAKVSAWLTSQGFTITSVARSSTFINFTGTVAQAQTAFGTTIHSLSYNGEQHISNTTDPMLPTAIASVVTAVHGLNDFKLKPRSRARHASAIDPSQPLYTQTLNGTTSHYISPADFYTIYDFNPLASTPAGGTGVTIAVMGQTDLSANPDPNITQFRTAAGLPAINLQLKLVGTDPGLSTGDIDESHLDLEWSGAAAPGATILFVYSEDVFNSLNYAIDSNVAPIITISYGECESGFGTAMLASMNLVLAQANAQGQTIMSSSGDSGSTDCDVTGLATEGLNVDFPASSPYVTASGGTMFSGDLNTPATYWGSSNGSSGGSVLSYIPEQPWNETTPSAGLGDSAGNGGGAGGGGASAFFSKPAWQVGTGVPNDSARDLPDFSLNAAAEHDGYLVCSSGDGEGETPCVSGFLSSDGVPNVFGGTSFVAPTFAGILALVEQKLGNNTRLGNVGPTLYGFLNGPTYSSVFHDITSGSNSVPCIQGTLNCPSGGSIGYTTGTGYDQASGIGSIDVNQLINGWSSVVPTGTGSTIGAGITTTALATSSQTCAVSSGTLALNVAVTGSISGTTPTGTVQFFVDNVAAGTPQPLQGGVITGYALITSSLASGGHTVSAVYSGDGNYAGSKGTLLAPANLSAVVIENGSSFPLYPNGALASVDIVSGTKPDFSITNTSSATPCSGTASVQPGATAPGITFVITPFNGFEGTVNLAATNQDGMAATTSFSVSPVSITTASGVTTSFVVQASQATTAKLMKPGLKPGQYPPGRVPWYAAGSGATLAGLLLLTRPRRRRWSALLAVVLSAAALTTFGCGGSSTSNTGGGGGGGSTTPVTDAVPGTYTFTITATTSTGLVHSIQAAYTVQ